jgi:hypothetical protein
MTVVFSRALDASLQTLDLPAETRAELQTQASRLATISIPEPLNGETKQAVKRDIEESFVRGFRVVMLIAAALALTSALFALLLIEGRALPVRGAASAPGHRLEKTAQG